MGGSVDPTQSRSPTDSETARQQPKFPPVPYRQLGCRAGRFFLIAARRPCQASPATAEAIFVAMK
jgi:hypothetical protein